MLLTPCLILDESLSDSEFAVVSGWKKATTMRFDFMKAPLTQAQAVVLTKMPAVTTLGLLYPSSSSA